MNKLKLYNAAIDFARELLEKVEQTDELGLDTAMSAKGAELGLNPGQYQLFKGWTGTFLNAMRGHKQSDDQAAAKAAAAKAQASAPTA